MGQTAPASRRAVGCSGGANVNFSISGRNSLSLGIANAPAGPARSAKWLRGARACRLMAGQNGPVEMPADLIARPSTSAGARPEPGPGRRRAPPGGLLSRFAWRLIGALGLAVMNVAWEGEPQRAPVAFQSS